VLQQLVMADFTAQFQNPRRLELLNALSDLIGDMLLFTEGIAVNTAIRLGSK
jgi:hypothetical protein